MSRGSGRRKWQPHRRAQSILWFTALAVKPHFASRRAGKILIACSDCAQVLSTEKLGIIICYSRVRFPPPPLFIGKTDRKQPEKRLSENGSENKSTDFGPCQ